METLKESLNRKPTKLNESAIKLADGKITTLTSKTTKDKILVFGEPFDMYGGSRYQSATKLAEKNGYDALITLQMWVQRNPRARSKRIVLVLNEPEGLFVGYDTLDRLQTKVIEQIV